MGCSAMELTIKQALKKGIEAHRAGKAKEADQYYTAILKAQPKHPDANHNMGVLAVGLSKTEVALPFLKTAVEANPSNAQFWLSYIDALIKSEQIATARVVFDQVRSRGAKGDAFDQIEARLNNPTNQQFQRLINLHNKGKFKQLMKECDIALKDYPKSYILYNIIGLTHAVLGSLDASIKNYKKAINLNPYHAETYYNLAVVLQEHNMLSKAIEAYGNALNLKPNYLQAHYNKGNAFKDLGETEKAISSYQRALEINPDYTEALNNMGNAFKDLGETEKAIEFYEKALDIDPNYAQAYYNMGNAFKNLGLTEKAISSYKKVLFFEPDHADAYNNMGNALKDLGRVDDAISAYKNLITFQPDYSNAHRSLSKLQKYSPRNAHFKQVKKLYKKSLSDEAKCNFGYALAKMYEDVGKIKLAFEHFSTANALRKRSLKYSIYKDQELFKKIKQLRPNLKKTSSQIQTRSSKFIPIFILGMPRSGTTLVEQIISSHSKVTGAGELPYISKYGHSLVTIPNEITKNNILDFRDKYFSKLVRRADNKRLITDKMPQNFLYLHLICSVFREAKIIHVYRDPRATCWSNFTHYFTSDNLGFSYDLQDVVLYYQMYFDLMQFWLNDYGDRIYSLDYDNLTKNQEQETRRLIKYLGITWENKCLSPEKNERSVMTASQQQVRKKVYTGSSEAWRKYEPYLDGVFDGLPSF